MNSQSIETIYHALHLSCIEMCLLNEVGNAQGNEFPFLWEGLMDYASHHDLAPEQAVVFLANLLITELDD